MDYLLELYDEPMMVLDINDNIIGKWGGRIEEGHPLNALYGYVR